MDLKTKTIGVLMGGLSGEREISLRSGENCARALESRGYHVVRIDAVRDVAQRLDENGVEVAFLAPRVEPPPPGTPLLSSAIFIATSYARASLMRR